LAELGCFREARSPDFNRFSTGAACFFRPVRCKYRFNRHLR